MNKVVDKATLKDKITKGYIHARVMFEIIGNPKEHIEKAIKLVIEDIKKKSNIEFLKEDYGEAEQTNDNLWGVYCESEILTQNLTWLGWVAFNYSPAFIEILEPTKFTFNDKEISDFINDFIGHIHSINQQLVQMRNENYALLKNMNAMTRNAVLNALGIQEKTYEEIGKNVGVKGKDILPVLEAMIKEGRLVRNGDKFKRANT